jgi:hypothetical protein
MYVIYNKAGFYIVYLSTEVKNSGAIHLLPHTSLLDCAEILKHKNNFIFFKKLPSQGR